MAGKRRRKKRPAFDRQLAPADHGPKKPGLAREPDGGSDAVVWQLQYLDDFPKPWRKADWHAVVERLRYLERLGWNRIWTESRKPNTDHMIPPNDITRDAQKRLVQLRLDDEDYLLSIRVRGGLRAWAVRIGTTSIARLLWWDPEHEVYPVAKRHT